MPYEKQFPISIVPPFRLDLTVWALRRRSKNLIDQWDGKQYSRVLVVEEKPVQVLAMQYSTTEILIKVRCNTELLNTSEVVIQQLLEMFQVNKDLRAFYQLAAKDKYLYTLVETFKGLKPPRFPTLFEAMVNAISCQQVTLDVGILLLNRLAERYGKAFLDQYAFPQPKDIYCCTEQDLQSLGYSQQKARAIIGIARAIEDGASLLEDMFILSDEEAINRLISIKGIGRWSAEYILLRGLGRINIFPGDDVGAQKNLMYLLNLPKRPSYDEIKEITGVWKPYAGFVYLHLLLDSLQKKNVL